MSKSVKLMEGGYGDELITIIIIIIEVLDADCGVARDAPHGPFFHSAPKFTFHPCREEMSWAQYPPE